MTDDLRQFETQLEQATQPGSELGDNLPPDTAALRAGWLALENLLDAAQEDMHQPLSDLPPRPVRRFNRAIPLAAAALAASLLVAVTTITYLRGVKSIPVSLSESAGVASNDGKASGKQSQPVVLADPKQEEQSQMIGNGEIAWDDSLDDEVESVRQAFRNSQHDNFTLASASSKVQYQLEILQLDFDEGSL